jgi:hypothetical protein
MATKKGTELQIAFFFTAHGCFLVENHSFLKEIGHCLYKKSDFQNIFARFYQRSQFSPIQRKLAKFSCPLCPEIVL